MFKRVLNTPLEHLVARKISLIMRTFRQEIEQQIVSKVLKCKSLKSDLFFKSHIYAIFFQGPGFEGSKFFRVKVFKGPDFSGSKFFLGAGFSGPGFSGSRFFWTQVFIGSRPFRVQIFLDSGFSGSRFFWIQAKVQVLVLEVAHVNTDSK